MNIQERLLKFEAENSDLSLRTSHLDCQIAIRRLLADLAAAHEEIARRAEDTERLNRLQALFDTAKPHWPLIGIQTVPSEVTVGAYNNLHGNEPGLVYGENLRKAIDAIDAARAGGGR